MFGAACAASGDAERTLSSLVGPIATDKLTFGNAMHLMLSYLMIETVQEVESYMAHLVVHAWAYHYGTKHREAELVQAATLTIRYAMPMRTTPDYALTQRRMLPHTLAYLKRISGTVTQ